MISDLLQAISPDTLVYAIKSNPLVVQKALNSFDSYKAFAEGLTNPQQIAISSNLYKLAPFFKSDAGKHAIAELTNDFLQFAEGK